MRQAIYQIKTMVTRMLNILGRKIDKLSENFNEKSETYKKDQS